MGHYCCLFSLFNTNLHSNASFALSFIVFVLNIFGGSGIQNPLLSRFICVSDIFDIYQHVLLFDILYLFFIF